MRKNLITKGKLCCRKKSGISFILKIGDKVNVTYDDSGIHIYPVVEESINLHGSLREEYMKYGFPDETDIDEATRKGLLA